MTKAGSAADLWGGVPGLARAVLAGRLVQIGLDPSAAVAEVERVAGGAEGPRDERQL